jgi:hypothetical protein
MANGQFRDQRTMGTGDRIRQDDEATVGFACESRHGALDVGRIVYAG